MIGAKCNFAHGQEELRNASDVTNPYSLEKRASNIKIISILN